MEILFICIYPAFLITTIVALIKHWIKPIKNDFSHIWSIIFSTIFTTIGPLIGFLRYNLYGSEKPFSEEHVGAVEMIVIVTALCYWLSRIAKERFSPFVNLLIRAALIQGIILDLIVTIHFANYLIMGIIWPTMGFELLAPPLAMLFLIYELQCNFKSSRQKNNPMVSVGENVLLQFGLVIVLVVVEQAMLLPAGFHWDSLISAFTESKGFVFSSDSRFQL